jgi:hypothetical protein
VKLGVVSLTPLDVLANMDLLLVVVVEGWSAQVSSDRLALVFVPSFMSRAGLDIVFKYEILV